VDVIPHLFYYTLKKHEVDDEPFFFEEKDMKLRAALKSKFD
jgi:hypothetical protein